MLPSRVPTDQCVKRIRNFLQLISRDALIFGVDFRLHPGFPFPSSVVDFISEFGC